MEIVRQMITVTLSSLLFFRDVSEGRFTSRNREKQAQREKYMEWKESE